MLDTLKTMPVILPLRKAIYDRQFASHKVAHYFRGVFDTFDDAKKFAPKTKPLGYNNDEAAKMYKERLGRLHSTDYPVLFWMEKVRSDVRRIFDFGGHIGIHYYAFPRFLDVSNISEWTVCEVEKVCEEGRLYASENPRSTKLNFVTDISKCEGYDLLLAKGSLQYLEWELHDKLVELKQRPRYLIINMTPLHPKLKTITLNSIGTAFCPYHIRKEDDFFNGLKKVGYDVLDIWNNEEKKCNIAFESERSLSYYKGAILKLSPTRE